jgi:DNA ligase (NAD+)
MSIGLYYHAKAAYESGNPILTDEQFDTLERKLIQTNPEILLSVGSAVRSGKVTLPHPMGSLDQKHDQAELDRWVTKIQHKEFIIMEKIDGNSCLVVYRDGKFVDSFSRGDGVNGANNSRHTIKISGIPKLFSNFTGTVRGELVIPKQDWPTVKAIAELKTGRVFANSRNFIAGFLNGSTGIDEIYPYVKFVAFDLLEKHGEDYQYGNNKRADLELLSSFGFTIPGHEVRGGVLTLNYSELQSEIHACIQASQYELDGVVIEANRLEDRQVVTGTEDLNPLHSVKIKPVSNAVVTTVTGVEWNISKDGLLKPVVHIEPVQLSGVTVSKASGYNARNILDQGIGPGATVMVSRRGDVIPCVDSVLDPVEAVLPSNSRWDSNQVELISEDKSLLEEMAARRLEYFFGKLGVDHMGPANVRALMSAGVITAVQAVKANRDLYVATIGLNGGKAYDQLCRVLSNVKPELILAALDDFGRGIGERKLRALFQQVNLDDFLDGRITRQQIVAIHGFEEKSADLILDNLREALENFHQIWHYLELDLGEDETVQTGKLTGKVICPTGVRFKDDVLAKIQSHGGIVADSMTGQVNILVAKDPNNNSAKIEKARLKGIQVISLEQLLEML